MLQGSCIVMPQLSNHGSLVLFSLLLFYMHAHSFAATDSTEKTAIDPTTACQNLPSFNALTLVPDDRDTLQYRRLYHRKLHYQRAPYMLRWLHTYPLHAPGYISL